MTALESWDRPPPRPLRAPPGEAPPATGEVTAVAAAEPPVRRSLARRRALVSFVVALGLWQLGATIRWAGHRVPVLGNLPAPSAVLVVWAHLLGSAGYWQSWYLSFLRVLAGFTAAVLLGVPFALFMAESPVFRAVSFPVFELLRPIPPLAWVPAAVIFWPTQELSIASVIFLGAIYPIVTGVVSGAEALDPRLCHVARSLGASRWNVFRRLLLPGVLPSLCTGMEVAIGVTWEVVVAAEMISGGGGRAGSTGGGLGFFIWSSYVGGSYPQIVVGMASIGIAGYLSSAAVRRLAGRFTPWARTR